MEQKGERGDENMSLHAIVGLMINRPHVDDVLEVGEGALDFRKLFVEAHRVDRGQIGLFGLDDVFALVGLLAREGAGMLEEANTAVTKDPVEKGGPGGGGRTGAGAAPIFSAALSRPPSTRCCSFSSRVRTRSMALTRCARSYARRSSE